MLAILPIFQKDLNLIIFFQKKGFTTKYRPWTVIHIEFFENKNEAIAREKFLKTGKGREFIKGLIFAQANTGSSPVSLKRTRLATKFKKRIKNF